jgi:hypothetical protein
MDFYHTQEAHRSLTISGLLTRASFESESLQSVPDGTFTINGSAASFTESDECKNLDAACQLPEVVLPNGND